MFKLGWSTVLFLLLASALGAAPAWESDLTSSTPGTLPNPVPGVIDMQLSWNGMISAGKMRIEFAPPDAKKTGAYVVRFSSSSVGAAAALYPYQTNFWSELDPKSLRPRYFQATEVDHKERVKTTVHYYPKRVESHQITRSLKTGNIEETRHGMKFAPMFDIFSAMLHIRSQKLADDDRITLLIHPLDSPYLLRVRVVAHEIHNGRSAIRLSVGMQKVDRETLELRPYKKLKKDVTLWLSDDADRIPIEFRASAFIGDVRATLTKHQKR